MASRQKSPKVPVYAETVHDEIGFWSEIKLDILRKYAVAYSSIVKNASSLSQVGNIEFELAGDEVDHGDEIASSSVAASLCFCCLNEAVDSL